MAVVAAAAPPEPLALGLFPLIWSPAIVLEIVLGTALGPHMLGRVSIDTPIQVANLLGVVAISA